MKPSKVNLINRFRMVDFIQKQTSLLSEIIQEKVLLVNNTKLMLSQQNKKSLMK